MPNSITMSQSSFIASIKNHDDIKMALAMSTAKGAGNSRGARETTSRLL